MKKIKRTRRKKTIGRRRTKKRGTMENPARNMEKGRRGNKAKERGK